MRIVAIAVFLLMGSGATALARETAAGGSPAHHAGAVQLAYLDGPTWYAIGGSFGSEAAAARRARQLGGNWYAQKSNVCANFTPGVWMVAAGFYTGAEARRYASTVGGYAKECL